MVRAISELELSYLDHLPRHDRLNAVRARAGDLPRDLGDGWRNNPRIACGCSCWRGGWSRSCGTRRLRGEPRTALR
jgi:hypothetical protein